MKLSPMSPQKKPYRRPKLEVYGDIRTVTQTAAPTNECDVTIASCTQSNYHSSVHTGKG